MQPRDLIIKKHLNAGTLEISVRARTADDYDITGALFTARHGNIQVQEDVTFFTLASRIYGLAYVDDWIAEQLPTLLHADTFADDADKAWELHQAQSGEWGVRA